MARRIAIIQYDKRGRILQAVTTLLDESLADYAHAAERTVKAMWLHDAEAAHVFVAEHLYPSQILRERSLA